MSQGSSQPYLAKPQRVCQLFLAKLGKAFHCSEQRTCEKIVEGFQCGEQCAEPCPAEGPLFFLSSSSLLPPRFPDSGCLRVKIWEALVGSVQMPHVKQGSRNSQCGLRFLPAFSPQPSSWALHQEGLRYEPPLSDTLGCFRIVTPDGPVCVMQPSQRWPARIDTGCLRRSTMILSFSAREPLSPEGFSPRSGEPRELAGPCLLNTSSVATLCVRTCPCPMQSRFCKCERC